MTQNPFDAFSKEYLADLLAPFGTVERSFEVPGESKFIDVLFLPTNAADTSSIKGLLKQVVSTPSLLEIYSGVPTVDEVSTCLHELFWLREDIVRKANSADRTLTENDYPQLWILAASLSEPLKKECAVIHKPGFPRGFYHFPSPIVRTIMVSLKDLPSTPNTLWMRVLGRGKTQENAIAEVVALPLSDPRRAPILRMLCAWKLVTIEKNPSLFENAETRAMAYPQIFLDWEAATEERGRQIGQQIGQQIGEQIGQQIGERIGGKEKALSIVLRLLHRRIGAISDALQARVMPLSSDQLEDLSEALLDFGVPDDLDRWLNEHPITQVST
ncbi:MAG: DUF4351 domain-containing protein [Alkalinema sp. CAN_BIN05]|nr:DUF4351 domain-containing protein [Alkalinema sp. CAN_BIN05]